MKFNEELDITGLKRALVAYKKMIKYANNVKNKVELDDYENHVVRAALIQHFEFSYELAVRFMLRFLTREGIEVSRSKRVIFREALLIGLIDDFEKWITFTDARNETSHSYDENIAEEVSSIAYSFYEEFERFTQTLENLL